MRERESEQVYFVSAFTYCSVRCKCAAVSTPDGCDIFSDITSVILSFSYGVMLESDDPLITNLTTSTE